MTYEDLVKAVQAWGKSKNINNPDAQTVKLVEEVGELCHEICREHYDTAEIKDAFGDIQVVLIILADMLNIDYTECLEMAWNTIKGRHGHTENGKFIKDE